MIAWHYTVTQHARSILRDGVIRPTSVGIAAREIPVVWFSVNQRWENTANKMVGFPDGRIKRLDARGTWEHFGAWRFGLPADELLPYRKLAKAARISALTQHRLERAARRMGADHTQWYGSLEPVLIARCTAEVLDVATVTWCDPLSS